jgi:hypothetical protein
VIGCPTCFTTTGGTITGATTFSGTVTVNGAVTSAGNLTTSAALLSSGGSGTSCNLQGTEFKNAANSGGDWYLYTGNACTYTSSLYFRWQPTTTVALQLDSGGNATFLGQVTATQYNVGSKRAWKQDIQPLSFDALQVLHDTDFAAFRYRRGHGNPQATHIGIIADDSPSVLSGKNHDHLDIEALATVDAKAILELHQQVTDLFIGCAVLVLCFLVTLGVALTKES